VRWLRGGVDRGSCGCERSPYVGEGLVYARSLCEEPVLVTCVRKEPVYATNLCEEPVWEPCARTLCEDPV
jgi:hypothetical protein